MAPDTLFVSGTQGLCPQVTWPGRQPVEHGEERVPWGVLGAGVAPLRPFSEPCTWLSASLGALGRRLLTSNGASLGLARHGACPTCPLGRVWPRRVFPS